MAQNEIDESGVAGNILIVDDTPANLRLLSGMLTGHGYKVRMAPNGKLALLNIQSTLPDLILLDVMMPGMSGYEVCEQLKIDPHTRDIPIIFISALDQVEHKVKAFTAGGVDYITKPFQLEEVLARVKTHMVLHTLQRQLERKNLELRKLTLAIEQSGSTIVITDTDANIEYVNPRFEETSGYTSDEVIGENPRILKSGEQSTAFYRDMWETVTHGRIWHGEFHNRHKDGTLYWELTTIAPIHDAAGEITNYIAIKEDITERKETQNALQRYAEQLALQNAELDAFAHTVAHDLKSPVGIIIGFTALLLEDYQAALPEDVVRSLQRIINAGRKLDMIIEELMLLTGVRKQTITPEPLEMSRVIQDAIERLQVPIQAQEAEITMRDETLWPAALGYGPWIEEVWANYISNAIKYGGVPPYVEIGAEYLPGHLSPEEDRAETVRFWVRDNGRGLNEEEQQHLFTPFTRLEQVHAKGHGLGLSIVRRIVERLGGRVGVESAGIGHGSTFWFELPAAR